MTIPNLLTTFRVVIIPIFISLVLYERFGLALALFFAAAISDILDGFFARSLKQRSRVGALIDPIADKLLLSASFITIGLAGLIPVWVVVLVVGRDSMALVGLMVIILAYKDLEIQPSIWGKLTTGAQGSLVVLVLGAKSIVQFPTLIVVNLWIVVGLTIISGGHYLYVSLRTLYGSGEVRRTF